MLACRPRPACPRPLVSSLGIVTAALTLALAPACGPGSAGGGTAGASGSSGGGSGGGTTGSAGNAGTTGGGGSAGAAAGTGGSASGQAGTTGRGGTGGGTAGSAGSSGGSAAGNGGTSGSAGSAGNAGTTGTAGSAAGRGGAGAAAGSGGSGTGGGGTTGTGGTVVATTCGAGQPSQPSGGASFPFPQHRASSNCIYPTTCSDADAMAGWVAYKAALIVADGTDGSMRVSRPENSNDTVSEGISYGMLFAVYMNDKTTFDALWKYEQKHLDAKGLMNWHINSSGTTAGMNSATDADEDMAFALVMADKQWGGYTTTATAMLTTVAMADFATDGSIQGGDTYPNAVTPSYIAPAFYRVFAAYGDNTRWTTILNKSYMLLASAQNATTGLVPDWSVGNRTNTNYGYDATRTPFRVAVDVCWSGDADAKTFSQKIGTFFAGIGAANIVDGYTVSSGAASGSNKNSTFIGPAGAAGMASNQTKLVADAYARVAADAKAAGTNYYDRSWALFTVMLMTGNFVNFQSP